MNSRHGSDLGKGEIAETAKATYGPMGDYRVAAGITDHDKRDLVLPFSSEIQTLARREKTGDGGRSHGQGNDH